MEKMYKHAKFFYNSESILATAPWFIVVIIDDHNPWCTRTLTGKLLVIPQSSSKRGKLETKLKRN